MPKAQVIIFRCRDIHTGGERYLAEIHAYLERQGVKVIPLWLDGLPRWPRRLGLVADCLISNFWLFFHVRRLGDVSGALFFEDFHLHPRLWLCNELIRRRTRQLRLVILMQSSLFYHNAVQNLLSRKLDEWAIRLFFRQAVLILCNSKFSQSEVITAGISPTKTVIVHCGHEIALRPSPIHRQANPDGTYHLLFVGQCASVKGLEYLLQAVALLKGREVVLDIVGNTAAEPAYFIKLSNLVTQLGLADRVNFHGHVSDKAKLAQCYEEATIFVLPSLVEGFGIVLLDAMSFGLPIVATKVGAIPELVEDGVNGLLVSPADPAALAVTIDKLLTSPELRWEYGRNGLHLAQQDRDLYSWEAVGERVLQAIQPLLKETH